MKPLSLPLRLLVLASAIAGFAELAPEAAAVQDGSLTGGVGSGAGYRAFLDEYCVGCHNERTRTAGLTLDTADLDALSEDAELWERVVRKVKVGMMPPPGARRPPADQADSLVSWLERSLDAQAPSSPGYIALHRLNRAEYANAVGALLGVDVDASALLPEDDISDGFTNIANVLKVSPSFLDQYISAARYVASRAVGDPAPRVSTTTLGVPAGTDQSAYVEGMPLGTRGGVRVEHLFPSDGEYEFDLAVSVGRSDLESRHRVVMMIDGEQVFEEYLGGEEDLKATDQLQAPARAAVSARFQNIRIPVTAGLHTIGVTFAARTLARADITLEPFVPGQTVDRIPRVGNIALTGPFNPTGIGETPSRRRIFVCEPSSPDQDLACATRILSDVARRAYRRPITDQDLAAPLAFYRDGRAGGDFDTGIRNGLTAILASPKFLYRVEEPPDLDPGTVYRIRDLDLASRLSFFLWSSGPDDELLDLASGEALRDPGVLDQQVRRMLADTRSESLVRNFAFQWLNLEGIEAIDPDPVLFPSYDDNLEVALLREMELFLESIIDEDRSVLDLLGADYTFVNERLALHYGIPNVQGSWFRRVMLEDERRWGLLGKGGVLMVTSYPNRTAPVLRGAWILERILGTPPAAPPPDVEAFPETEPGARALTVRARMEAHRASPACNGCHGVMDPLGFALEHFDAVGEARSRDRYAGTPIDASGRLVDGTPVGGAPDLRRALLERPEQFVQTMTEKLLTFALGRRVEYSDMPAVRAIVRNAALDDYRFSSIVRGIVNSTPFQMKQIPDGGAPRSGAAASLR